MRRFFLTLMLLVSLGASILPAHSGHGFETNTVLHYFLSAEHLILILGALIIGVAIWYRKFRKVKDV